MGANLGKSPLPNIHNMEEVQTQFKTEGQPAFPVSDEGNDNPTGSSPAQTDTTQTPSDGGEQKPDAKQDEGAGFAEHPRWKEREGDWTKRFNDQEQRHVQELQSLREEFDRKYGQKPNAAGTPNELPSWFGGDQEDWEQFLAWNESQVKKAQEGAVQHLTAQQQDEQKRVNEATDYFNAQVTALETDKEINPNGDKVDRNKLMKFVLDNKVVDTEGRWNWRAGYLAMRGQPQKESSTKDRKALASATTSDKRVEPKEDEVMGSDDFKKAGARPW